MKRNLKRTMHNPLKDVDGEMDCVCQSGKKIKHCCGIPNRVPIKWGNECKKLIKDWRYKKSHPQFEEFM